MKKLFCGELSCFQFRMPDSESQFQNCRFHHRWPSWLSGWSSEHQRRRSVDQTLTSPIFIKLFCTSKPTLVFLVVWLSYTGLHETYTCRTRVLFSEVWTRQTVAVIGGAVAAPEGCCEPMRSSSAHCSWCPRRRRAEERSDLAPPALKVPFFLRKSGCPWSHGAPLAPWLATRRHA